MVAEKKHGRVKKNTWDDLFVGSEARFSRWWNVRKRKCHCHASTRRPRRSGGLLFMKGGETIGARRGGGGGGREKKEMKKRNPPATWRYAYIYIHIVNCQRYYGLCPVSDQQNLPPPFFCPFLCPLPVFFPTRRLSRSGEPFATIRRKTSAVQNPLFDAVPSRSNTIHVSSIPRTMGFLNLETW